MSYAKSRFNPFLIREHFAPENKDPKYDTVNSAVAFKPGSLPFSAIQVKESNIKSYMVDTLQAQKIAVGKLIGFTIQTGAQVGALGVNGVIMDTEGLRGYNSALGKVFDIPTNGDQPTFSNGVILVSEINSTNISGGTVTGAVIVGGTIKTAGDGRRVEIDSAGIKAINGSLGYTYGEETKLYGDGGRFYGSGVLVYINNNDVQVPFYVNQEQTVADIHLYNRSSTPTGKAEIGDLAVVNNKLYICTSAGTPGTWTVAGTQS